MSVLTVALAGNPNVGKSTLFNALTGSHQHTGNWAGKTVDVARGVYKDGEGTLALIDLPGTYSLYSLSPEEGIAKEYIESGEADATLVVCDATCLERNLILVLQILAVTGRVCVCVNLLDEGKKNGVEVDIPRLSELLGVPVVGTSAGRGKGIGDAVAGAREAARGGRAPDPKEDTESIALRARTVAKECVRVHASPRPNRRERIDRILTGRVTGVPVMLCLLFFVLWLTAVGANFPSELLSNALFSFGGVLRGALAAIGAPEVLCGLLIDGVYTTTAWVVGVMLPPMAIFFPLFTLLEDLGYLPRLAFNLDGTFKKCGSCGKQALTM